MSPEDIAGLVEVLIDCVEGGASVSFMLPMTRAKALDFWTSVADGVQKGERLVVIAEDAEGCLGTAQVVLAQPENQPHRADLAKMLVHRRGRRRGVGAAVLAEAERLAFEAGKRLLVLDTASPEAERLYARSGWRECGYIPGYALMPDGALCGTRLYFKELGSRAEDAGFMQPGFHPATPDAGPAPEAA